MSADLVLAYVNHIEEIEDMLWARIHKGGYKSFTGIDTAPFCEGDVVVIDQENGSIELAPEMVWEELSWLGVVRLKTDTDTVISEGSLLRLVPTREDPEYEVGNTVKVRDDFGVVEVLSEESVDSLDSLRSILREDDFR